MKTADSQLARLSGGGLLVMDVSLLVADRLPGGSFADYKALEAAAKPLVTDLAAQVRSLVDSNASWADGRGVTATCVIARLHRWLDDSPRGRPGAAFAMKWRRYYRTAGSLAFWRATALGERVEAAIRVVSPETRVRWEK